MPLPRPLRVSIQGEQGSFSEEAVGKLLNRPHHVVATPDLARMFSAVGRHEAHACLAPMENSLVGSIFESYDLLLQFGFRILGEVYLRVEHCLIAPLGTYLEDVQRVYSHPVALDQCGTQGGLQFLEAGTQGRLRHGAALGRAAKMTRIGDCDEIAQLAQAWQALHRNFRS